MILFLTGNSIQNAQSFYAPLTTSLVPAMSIGFSTPTFTRATTATVTDFEGVVRTVLSGEARFQGARRVRNSVTFSQDFGNAAWTKGNAAVTTDQIAAPDGTTTADLLTNDTTNGEHRVFQTHSLASPNVTQSVYAKAGTASFISIGAGTASLPYAVFNLSTGVVSSQSNGTGYITDAGNGWYRCVVVPSGLTGNMSNLVINMGETASQAIPQTNYVGTSKTVYLWGAQAENTTGQSSALAAAYVSTNVLSAPYHGANVDAVKYFDTAVDGTPIASSTLKGYLAEGSRTNIALQSEDFNDAGWGKNSTTISANATSSPNGSVTADKIIPSAANTFHDVERPMSTTAQNYTVSCYVKKSEYALAGLRIYPNLTCVIFNLDTLAIDNSTGTYISASAVNVGTNGWVRISVTILGVAGTSYFGVAAATSGYTFNGSAYPSFAGDGTSGIYAWGFQVEDGSFSSSYIPTTTVSVTRNADVLTYALASNISATVGSLATEISTEWAGTTAIRCDIASSATGSPLYIESSAGKLSINDGAAQLGNVLTGSASVQKVASTWGGTAGFTYIAGTASSSLSFDGDLGLTTSLGIGNQGGATQLFGTLRNLRIFNTVLTAAQVASL